MAINQIWGKLFGGGKLLFEGELFISDEHGLAGHWSVTFAATHEIYELFITGPITVQLSDGRLGDAVVDRAAGRPFELVVKLRGSGRLV